MAKPDVRLADLHMHSTFSDGVLKPQELVHECAEAGIQLMALTDHDTFQGSDRLCRQFTQVPVIPGVQLSMNDIHGLHLLGYGLTAAVPLREKVRELEQNRIRRAKQILSRLESMGMPLDWDDLVRRSSGSVGRPHIARAMVHAGYVGSMQEAFARYLGHDCPAYVDSVRMSMRESLALLRENGFVPVLAHPRELKLEDGMLSHVVERWIDQGLMGIEVYHPSARAQGFGGLDHMARRLGLLVTGGSDFHQQNDKHGALGSTCKDWVNCTQDIRRLWDALQQEEQRVKSL